MNTLVTIVAICFIISTICYVSGKFRIETKRKISKKQSPPIQKKGLVFSYCYVGDTGDCSHVMECRDHDAYIK